MCGKEAIISNGHDNKDDKDQPEPSVSNIIVEQIDGICYTFDTEDRAIIRIFKFRWMGYHGRTNTSYYFLSSTVVPRLLPACNKEPRWS